MKRLLKKVALFIAAFLVLTALSSCTLLQSTETAYIDDVDDDGPLKIYLLNFVSDNERIVIKQYNSIAARGLIDSPEIEITEFEIEQMEDMNKQIATEMMAGKGPDIIFIDYPYCSKNDFVKISANNAFADMDILAKNCETFNFEDYNEMVMDASVINGKRYMMPISYTVPYVITTKEVFEKNNIELPEKLDFENTLSIITEYEMNNPMDNYGFIYYLQDDIFSLGTSKVSLDSDIFKKYNERHRRLHIERNNSVPVDNITEKVCDAEELLYFEYFSWQPNNQYNVFSYLYNKANNYSQNNIVFLEMPCNHDGVTKAFIDKAIAINSNSKHKNAAFKFVEYLMSYGINIGVDIANLPVNKKAYEEYKRRFTTETKDIFGLDNALEQVIPSDLAEDCINIIENVSTCEFIGQAQAIMGHEEMRKPFYDYWMQETDYDTMIKELKSKLDLYYSE